MYFIIYMASGVLFAIADYDGLIELFKTEKEAKDYAEKNIDKEDRYYKIYKWDKNIENLDYEISKGI